MPATHVIDDHFGKLSIALDDSNWRIVDKARDALRRYFLRALVDGDRKTATDIADKAAAARARFVITRKLTPEINETTVAAKLMADIEAFAIGKGMYPTLATLSGDDLSAKERVYQAVARANAPISNVSIVQQTGMPAETVSRMLKVLRLEGRISSFKAGKLSLNKALDRRPVPRRMVMNLPILPKSTSVDMTELAVEPATSFKLYQEESGDGDDSWVTKIPPSELLKGEARQHV